MSQAHSFTLAAALCAASLSLATAAHAQEGGSSAPAARTGFQLAVRAGYAVPMGKFDAGAGEDMSNVFSGQVPFTVDVGAKVTENIFLGGYAGLAVGGTAGTWNLAESTAPRRARVPHPVVPGAARSAQRRFRADRRGCSRSRGQA